MTYRRIHVQYESGPEWFSIRISDEGFQEWLRSRDWLRANGMPDRPPDVDTPTVRAWVAHPGEEDLPYFVNQREQEAMGVQPVLTMRWAVLGVSVQLYVNSFADGTINVDAMELVNGDALAHVGQTHGPDADPTVAWDEIEGLIDLINSRSDWTPEVTWPWDFLEMEAERALAQADVAAGFVNPLPEGPVQ